MKGGIQWVEKITYLREVILNKGDKFTLQLHTLNYLISGSCALGKKIIVQHDIIKGRQNRSLTALQNCALWIITFDYDKKSDT